MLSLGTKQGQGVFSQSITKHPGTCRKVHYTVFYTAITGNRQPLSRKRRKGMGKHSPLNIQSAQLKKALIWMAEMIQEQPQKDRQCIVDEAELRFDLNPLECEFLNKHFTDTAP
jgi:hypothetical protein